MKSTPLHLPTLNEQQEINRRAEELFVFVDWIEASLVTARKTVELTLSIHAKAFRGELVPQKPQPRAGFRAS